MRLRIATALALLVALAPGAVADAQTPLPKVLKRSPYYLSLHRAEPPARGTVLLMHGGGWQGDLGAAADEVMETSIDALHEWGYDVANLGYRGGSQSLTDAEKAFDLLRKQLGPKEPICIFGASAGGQLGLMVAAERGRDVDCVVDLLGPPDLTEFGARAESERGQILATLAFGAERLDEVSPISNVDRIRSPVLVGAATCDRYIEVDAQRELVDALNDAGGEASLEVIKSGDDLNLEHCEVDGSSYRDFQAATRSFLAEVAPQVSSASDRDPIPVPADDDSGVSLLLLVLAATVIAGGLGLLAAALRR